METGALGEIQEQKRTGTAQIDLAWIVKNVWKKRVDELVSSVALLLDEGTGKADVMSIRVACKHTVQRAVEHLSSDDTGRLRNC